MIFPPKEFIKISPSAIRRYHRLDHINLFCLTKNSLEVPIEQR